MVLMCFCLSQVRDHSTAVSVGPPLPRRETCFATSNCTLGRSLSNAPCAATPAVDVTLWAGTCAPILVPASHIHTQSFTREADTHWYHMRRCTVSCWLVSHSFRLFSHFFLSLHTWGLLSLHGSSSNTCHALIQLHTSHMTSYSFTSGNLLIHFQFTCFTCRHSAVSYMHIISFVWNHVLKEIILIVLFRCCQMDVSCVNV